MKTIEQKYQRLTDIEHVLKRPGRYVGSINPITVASWIKDEASPKFIKKELTWNPGFLKMFDEVITNSVDHSKRPEGKHLDEIRVEINRKTGEISVSDNGGIPVVKHAEYDEYVPTLIFGYLRSGSNFDDNEDSDGAGQNGEGASLTNIFSTEFKVETGDGKKKFYQKWTKNMMERTEAKIGATSDHFTKISYTPDYAHLKTTLDDDNYAKLIKRVYDIAGCNPKLRVVLNGKLIRINTFKDYIGLYVETFEYDENADWQIGIGHSDNGFTHVSFVNSTETFQGGTHVAYVSYAIANRLREYFKKKHKVEVKPTDILNHIQLFINARIINPRYNSQTKENLMTEVKEYKTSWEPSEKFIGKILKSEIIDQVLAWVEAKVLQAKMAALKGMNKDADKTNPKRIIKLQDANLAGKEPERCVLFLTEGDCLEESTEVVAIKADEQVIAKIGDLRCNDLVLTHNGRFKKITHIAYSIKPSLKIKTTAGELIVGHEHPLLALSTITDEIDWIKACDLDARIHKLVRSTLVDVVHANITAVAKIDDLLKISYDLAGEQGFYMSTNKHGFHIFDMNDLSYKIIEAAQIVPDHHYLTFRYKYDIFTGRNELETAKD